MSRESSVMFRQSVRGPAARAFYIRVIELSVHADSDRPALQRTRSYLDKRSQIAGPDIEDRLGSRCRNSSSPSNHRNYGLLALGPRVDKHVSVSIVGDVVVAIKAGAVIDILAGVFQ